MKKELHLLGEAKKLKSQKSFNIILWNSINISEFTLQRIFLSSRAGQAFDLGVTVKDCFPTCGISQSLANVQRPYFSETIQPELIS
jgi:hypothetical protein